MLSKPQLLLGTNEFMATQKTRIQAYIDPEIFKDFEADRIEQGYISQSQALENILIEKYGSRKPAKRNTDLEKRLAELEKAISPIIEKMNIALNSKG